MHDPSAIRGGIILTVVGPGTLLSAVGSYTRTAGIDLRGIVTDSTNGERLPLQLRLEEAERYIPGWRGTSA